MEPITLTAIAVGIFLSACGTRPYDGAISTSDTDAGNSKDTTAIDAFVAADSVGLPADIKPMDTYDSTDVATDTPLANTLVPTFPLQGAPKLFAESPCGTNSFINDIDDKGIGTCSGGINMVFTLNKNGIGQKSQLDVMPDQVDMDANGDIAIAAISSKGEPGALRMYGIAATPSWVGAGKVTVDQQEFVPHFLKGIQKLATGQLVMVGGDIQFEGMNATGYSPGVALVFSGTATTPQSVPTQGHNPTSIGSWTQSGVTYVGIINTEALDASGNSTGQMSSLTVLNLNTLQPEKPITLPTGGLGVAGELAVAGGFLAIPSADNSGHIYLLNSQNLSATPQTLTIADAAISSGKYLVSFVKILDHYLIAGSYNSSMISTWDLSTSPATPLPAVNIGTTGIGDAACISADPDKPCTLVFAAMDKVIQLQ